MERLSHDLNLALEESNCQKQGRRKLGFRRRTRSAGNLPTCIATMVEDGSSSSPSHPPIVTQPLSDSDDLQQVGLKSRVAVCAESDSLNDTASPARPSAIRRKRKYKKMAVDYDRPPTPRTLQLQADDAINDVELVPNQGISTMTLINKKKRLFKPDRASTYCGKRKWSHRDREGGGEMRERSFSGGCASKSYFFGKNYNDFKNGKKFGIEKMTKFKEKPLHPPKLIAKNIDPAKLPPATFQPALPGSSSFNFVYRNPKVSSAAFKTTGFKVATDLPPIFNANSITKPEPSTSSVGNVKTRRKVKVKRKSRQSPLNFDENSGGMDCSMDNEVGSSSSISSSDSDGVVTCESDREGDDELTDWPGSEELSVFNKTLNLRTSRNGLTKANVQKISKKEKYLPKHGLSSCKNKLDKIKSLELDSNSHIMEDDTMMSDSAVEVKDKAFTSFSDVKNAGIQGNNVNKLFYNAFQAYQEKSDHSFVNDTTQSSFSLQKTSSSDLNLSEKSPQSDNCYSEHSFSNAAGLPEIREIRAGCRRVRDERPSLLILSAANEQLSKFLQDSQQLELRLPCLQNDQEEREKLECLAKLYSLELRFELGRPILQKTANTTQAVSVEQNRRQQGGLMFSEFKRRCYGDPTTSMADHKFANSNDTTPNSADYSECEFATAPLALSGNSAISNPGDIE